MSPVDCPGSSFKQLNSFGCETYEVMTDRGVVEVLYVLNLKIKKIGKQKDDKYLYCISPIT